MDKNFVEVSNPECLKDARRVVSYDVNNSRERLSAKSQAIRLRTSFWNNFMNCAFLPR